RGRRRVLEVRSTVTGGSGSSLSTANLPVTKAAEAVVPESINRRDADGTRVTSHEFRHTYRNGNTGEGIGPLISIGIPLLNEELVLRTLYGRLTGMIADACLRCEVVLVDDGSSDGTHAIARQLCEQDSRFKLVRLSRNFGHQMAITAGIDKASGDAV